MRPILTATVVTTAFVFAALPGCKKEDPAPAPVYPQQQYPQQQYPQQQVPQQQYPQTQPAQPYPTVQPQPTVAPPPVATAAPATGGMNPNPQGGPCTSDAQCLTHKCNTAAGKCSYPCVTAADCGAGMQCIAPICVPTMPGAAPAK